MLYACLAKNKIINLFSNEEIILQIQCFIDSEAIGKFLSAMFAEFRYTDVQNLPQFIKK